MLFVIDLETTGLDPKTAGVWDLGAVAVHRGEIVSEFQTHVYPGRECLQTEHLDVVQRVSGVSPQELIWLLHQTAPSVPLARRQLLEWMLKLSGVKAYPNGDEWKLADGQERVPLALTSYNVGFDAKFLRSLPWSIEHGAHGMGCCEIAWAPCVMVAASDELGRKGLLPSNGRGGYRWPKLPLACQHYGVEFVETHRALSDARAAAQLAILLRIPGAVEAGSAPVAERVA